MEESKMVEEANEATATDGVMQVEEAKMVVEAAADVSTAGAEEELEAAPPSPPPSTPGGSTEGWRSEKTGHTIQAEERAKETGSVKTVGRKKSLTKAELRKKSNARALDSKISGDMSEFGGGEAAAAPAALTPTPAPAPAPEEAKKVEEATEAEPSVGEYTGGIVQGVWAKKDSVVALNQMFSGLGEARDEILRLRAQIAWLDGDAAAFAERLQDAKEERAFANQKRTLAMDTTEGFLFKEGSERWKLRYFVVDRTCLSYFEDDVHVGAPKGVFFLSPTSSVLVGNEQSLLKVSNVRPAHAPMGAAQTMALAAAEKEAAQKAAAPQHRILNTRMNQASGISQKNVLRTSVRPSVRPAPHLHRESAKPIRLPPPSGAPPVILPPPPGAPPKLLPPPSNPPPVVGVVVAHHSAGGTDLTTPKQRSGAPVAGVVVAHHSAGGTDLSAALKDHVKDEATGQIEEAVGTHVAEAVLGGELGDQVGEMFGGEIGGRAIKGMAGAAKGFASMANFGAHLVHDLSAKSLHHSASLKDASGRPACPATLSPFSFALMTNGAVLKLACENDRELKHWTGMFKERIAFLQTATRGYLKVDKGKWANADGTMVQRCVLRGGEWKQFHFVLEPECLHAFKDQSLEKSKGVFAFEEGCTLDTDIAVGGNNQNRIFAMVNKTGSTYFEAENDEEYEMW
jgi:hypothetical protein